MVMDIAKRSEPALQTLSLQTLASWSHVHPERVLPFLSSRLHSSFAALQATALGVLITATAHPDDVAALEHVLTVLPLVGGLLSSAQ